MEGKSSVPWIELCGTPDLFSQPVPFMLDHVTISVIDKRNTTAMTNTNGAIKYSCVKLSL